MNKNNSTRWHCVEIPSACDLCKNHGLFFLEARNFFGRKTRWLCKDHAVAWYRGELNV